MDFGTTARQLAALGHEHRLQLFYLLVRAGRDGMTVGEIQETMDRPTSTVTFHLRELVAAGLVSQEREGRSVRCRAEFQTLGAVLDSVRRACCSGVPASRRKKARI